MDWEMAPPSLLFHGIVVACLLRVVVVQSSLANLTIGPFFPGVLTVCSAVIALWVTDVLTHFAIGAVAGLQRRQRPNGLGRISCPLRCLGGHVGAQIVGGGWDPAALRFEQNSGKNGLNPLEAASALLLEPGQFAL